MACLLAGGHFDGGRRAVTQTGYLYPLPVSSHAIPGGEPAMGTADTALAVDGSFSDPAAELRLVSAALDRVNSAVSGTAASMDGRQCGGLLVVLGEIQAKL